MTQPAPHSSQSHESGATKNLGMLLLTLLHCTKYMPIFVKIVEKPSLRDQMWSILGDCVAGRIPQEGQKMHPVGRNPQQF